jgi:integrase
MLVRVVVEVLLRTGLRIGEFVALIADAVVLIGAGHWLYVPVGKLHDDRYLRLHPHLVTLIGDYRSAHVAPDNPLLLPRENGRPLDRHTITRLINKAGAAAGLPISIPINCGTRWPPRPSTDFHRWVVGMNLRQGGSRSSEPRLPIATQSRTAVRTRQFA